MAVDQLQIYQLTVLIGGKPAPTLNRRLCGNCIRNIKEPST